MDTPLDVAVQWASMEALIANSSFDACLCQISHGHICLNATGDMRGVSISEELKNKMTGKTISDYGILRVRWWRIYENLMIYPRRVNNTWQEKWESGLKWNLKRRPRVANKNPVRTLRQRNESHKFNNKGMGPACDSGNHSTYNWYRMVVM